VKRYTDPLDESGRAYVYEDAEGEFVRFEDYERLCDLLRAARKEVEWWTPDESNATELEGERLNNKWFPLRDKIDAAISTADTSSALDTSRVASPSHDTTNQG
jgi:hypothetical protein